MTLAGILWRVSTVSELTMSLDPEGELRKLCGAASCYCLRRFCCRVAIEEKQKPREQLDALVTEGSAPLTRRTRTPNLALSMVILHD